MAFDVADQIRQLPYQITCIDTFSCQSGGRGSPATSDHCGIVSLQSQAIKFRNSNFVIKEVNYMVKTSKGLGIRVRNKRQFVIAISL